MVFSSFLFLFLFLPFFWLSYFVAPRRFKNGCLLLWSYFFYGWGAPAVLPLLIGLSVFDYLLAGWYAGLQARRRQLACGFGVAVNVAFLGYFKYANFFVEQLNTLLQTAGSAPLPWLEVALPIGISFFTFQKISYLVDVYRGVVQPAGTFLNYALYVALFPQLIAGPIIRYHDIQDQIIKRAHRLEDVFSGLCRFSVGLGKKVLLADAMGNVADNVFSWPMESLTTGYAWLGVLCYAYQIYFDFSGYSDMAIGLGRMMGFRIPENFNCPYIAQNFTEFWRRWHISLSNWMKEYLYIPLGGNRTSAARRYLNLWIVFLLSGFWHGASWNFVFWGAFHGFFLTIDKLFWRRLSLQLPRVVNVLLTFFFVLLSWVLFRAENLAEALAFYQRLFLVRDPLTLLDPPILGLVIHPRGMVVLLVSSLLCFAPLLPAVERWVASLWQGELTLPRIVLRGAGALGCFIFSVLALSATDYNPFIYFRF